MEATLRIPVASDPMTHIRQIVRRILLPAPVRRPGGVSRVLLFCAIWLLPALSGCNGQGEGGDSSVLKLAVEMTEYGSGAVPRKHVWTGTDRIGVIPLPDGIPVTVSPVSTGSETALFPFVSESSGREIRLLGYYPSDAGVRLDGNSLQFEIPSLQDGEPIALSAGIATGTPGSYSGTSLSLKPLYRLVPVNLGRMPHTVTALTLRARDGTLISGKCRMDVSSGEITASESSIKVKLPKPLDCRDAAAVVGVMVAGDQTASLSAEVETVEGNKIEISDVNAYSGEMNTPYTIGTSLGINSSQTAAKIKLIKDAGIEWVEVTCNSFQRNIPESEWETRAENIRKILADLGLKIWSCHLPFSGTLDISVLDDDARRANIELQKRMIRLCGEKYHPQRLVLHPSSEPITEAERPRRLENARAAIGELAPVAKEIGAVLCIENLPRTCLGRVVSEMEYLIEPYPDVMVCFDTNHLLQETHQHYFEVLGSRIGTIHVSDYDRTDERHWLPGKGVIDWPAFHWMLRLSGYDGIFMYEVKSSAGTAAEVAKSYRNVIFTE